MKFSGLRKLVFKMFGPKLIDTYTLGLKEIPINVLLPNQKCEPIVLDLISWILLARFYCILLKILPLIKGVKNQCWNKWVVIANSYFSKYLICILCERLFCIYCILGVGFTSSWDVLLKVILDQNRCCSVYWYEVLCLCVVSNWSKLG